MTEENSLIMIKYLYDRLETVQKIVTNCPKEDIQMNLFRLLQNLFSNPAVKSDEEKIPQKFAIHFWNLLISTTNIFTIRYINQIFSEWLNNYPDDAIALNYHKTILGYLIEINKKHSSTSFNKKDYSDNYPKDDLNTKSFIQFILYSMDHYEKEEISIISEHFEEILQIFREGDITNLNTFINKIRIVCQIDIFEIFKSLVKTKSNNHMLKIILRILLFNNQNDNVKSFNQRIFEIFDTIANSSINLKIINKTLKKESQNPNSLEYICKNLAPLLQELIISSDSYQNDESESLFLKLFSFVSPMNDYCRAENIEHKINSYDISLIYHEYERNDIISSSDIALLKTLLDYFLPSGLNWIMDNPDRYINKCNNLDRRYANYLRVLQWIVRRTKYIRPDQIDNFITFFIYLSNLHCSSNYNIIEAWRIFDSFGNQSLYDCVKKRSSEFFDAATRIYNNPIISSSSFIFLTHTLEKFIEKDKDNVFSFIGSLQFQTFINYIVLNSDQNIAEYFSRFFDKMMVNYAQDILDTISNFSESLIFKCPFSTLNIFSLTKVKMNNSQFNSFLRYFANLPAEKSNSQIVKSAFYNLIYLMIGNDNFTPIRPPEVQPNLIRLIPLIEHSLVFILERREYVKRITGVFDFEGCLAKFMSVYGLDDFNVILDNIKYDENHPLFWMFTALRIALMKDKDDESTTDEFIAITSLLTVTILENSSNWAFNKELEFAIDRCILQLSLCKLKGEQWAADLFASFVQDKSLRNVFTKEFILKEDPVVVNEILDQLENKEEIQSYVEHERKLSEIQEFVDQNL